MFYILTYSLNKEIFAYTATALTSHNVVCACNLTHKHVITLHFHTAISITQALITSAYFVLTRKTCINSLKLQTRSTQYLASRRRKTSYLQYV